MRGDGSPGTGARPRLLRESTPEETTLDGSQALMGRSLLVEEDATGGGRQELGLLEVSFGHNTSGRGRPPAGRRDRWSAARRATDARASRRARGRGSWP
jgi:hypothetical protein